MIPRIDKNPWTKIKFNQQFYSLLHKSIYNKSRAITHCCIWTLFVAVESFTRGGRVCLDPCVRGASVCVVGGVPRRTAISRHERDLQTAPETVL